MNPENFERLLEKAVLAKSIALASKEARDLTRLEQTAASRSTLLLPGKYTRTKMLEVFADRNIYIFPLSQTVSSFSGRSKDLSSEATSSRPAADDDDGARVWSERERTDLRRTCPSNFLSPRFLSFFSLLASLLLFPRYSYSFTPFLLPSVHTPREGSTRASSHR